VKGVIWELNLLHIVPVVLNIKHKEGKIKTCTFLGKAKQP
jgi:hypothetical protein